MDLQNDPAFLVFIVAIFGSLLTPILGSDFASAYLEYLSSPRSILVDLLSTAVNFPIDYPSDISDHNNSVQRFNRIGMDSMSSYLCPLSQPVITVKPTRQKYSKVVGSSVLTVGRRKHFLISHLTSH